MTRRSSSPASDLDQARRSQARKVLRRLKSLYPEVVCGLDFENAYQLLVATILSAQCTDKRVNLVTPEVFAAYPGVSDLAGANLADLEALIRTIGFYHNKARNLIAMANQVVQDHRGVVPRQLEALTQLAGVGRKTAHVVLGNAFGIASGVVVDTHVKRLSNRLGLTEQSDPVRIEVDLAQALPKTEWIDFSHRLINHGRAICRAQRPLCSNCTLIKICPQTGVERSA